MGVGVPAHRLAIPRGRARERRGHSRRGGCGRPLERDRHARPPRSHATHPGLRARLRRTTLPVVSDSPGVTGQRIIRALLDGERGPRVLARLRDRRCQQDEETIARSLEGTWRSEQAPLRVAAGGGPPRLLPAADRGLRSRDRGCLGGFAHQTAGHTLPAKPRTTKPNRTAPPSMSAPTSIASRASISPASAASTRPSPSKSSRRPASTRCLLYGEPWVPARGEA